ncbi:MAG: M4 family metallopeptidase [Chitinophagales bacterium]|nr:M4 family metallopeptidase [Chitinophagales bacterium]
MMNKHSTYADARAATRQAAIDWYGICSNEVAQVGQAWGAVNVTGTLNTYCCTISGPSAICDDGSDLPATYFVTTRAGSKL